MGTGGVDPFSKRKKEKTAKGGWLNIGCMFCATSSVLQHITETNDYWWDALLWRKNNFQGEKKLKMMTKKKKELRRK